jgi:hypothetical protein
VRVGRATRVLATRDVRRYGAPVPTLETASWGEIEAFRDRIALEVSGESSLCAAAQRFVAGFVATFPSIVLSRLFAVVPFRKLPSFDADTASRFADGVNAASLLLPNTPVLSLLGSCGANPQWNDRALSGGHLAIPLLSRALVEGIPMIAQLLADVGMGLAWLDDVRGIDSRRMLGSQNQCFYVAKASESRDDKGRLIIPSQAFVTEYRIETVFGMAGSYVDGTMLASISFSTEAVKKASIDRFPSVIANFKVATTAIALRGQIYPAPSHA